MAILHESEILKESCFYCGEGFSPEGGPAVYWGGFKDVIFLHLKCAFTLAEKLTRDIKNAQRLLVLHYRYDAHYDAAD